MKLLGRSLLPVMLSLLPTLALVPSSRVAFRAGLGRRPALRGLRSAALRSTAAESTDYSKTVLLPSTGFPQRADGATREVEIQSWWEKRQTYERLWATAQANEAAKFTLHDGPPYANGDLHMGHALNKVLKDMVNRYQMLSGKAVRFVPGWDCHGLPIELKVLQKMKSKERQGLTPVALRAKAGDFAKATVESQKAAFKRYGVWADWEAPYLTLQPEYEAAQIGVFAEMALAGHVYRGLKPVYWSPSSRTALAEAELEYPPEHTSRAVYAAFDVVAASPKLAQVAGGEPCRVAVWTTTAWTLPANLLVAVNADLVYAVVDAGRHGRLVVAKALVGELTGKLAGEEAGFAIEVVGELTGAELADGTTYARPFPGTAVGGAESKVVVGGDYITDEGGTGLVHTAPGHGADDYATGLKYGLEPFAPVDDGGRFTAQAGAELEKLNVLKEGTEACVEALGASGALLLDEAYAHKYPYDWRTKKPVITRATSQWFASCDSFQDEALAAIETVEWLPAAGKNRITAFVKGRNDWCISRQRTWGVPIPVFYERATGEPLLTAETLKHVQGIVAEHGTDAWFAWETADLLPPALKARADEFEKGRDTMDVWFDSGTSWAGVVGARGDLLGALPADMYLEGSDQHRGWFQSSLLTSVAANPANPVAPYKSVLTHGFVLDEKGFKMSKSVGNVVDPYELMLGGKDKKQRPAYGAEVLRLWIASVDYTADVNVGPNIIKQKSEELRRMRNTFRYLLGNLDGVDASDARYDVRDPATYASLPSVDKWALGQLAAVVAEARGHYDAHQFSKVYNAVVKYTQAELSNFYFEQAKDRLYISGKDSARRTTCQATLRAIAEALSCVLAPMLPHLCEDAWQHMAHENAEAFADGGASVFEQGWPSWAEGFAPHEAEAWAGARALRDDVNRAIEMARKDKAVGASLEASVVVAGGDPAARAAYAMLAPRGLLDTHAPADGSNGVDDLRFMLQVASIEDAADAAAVRAACDPSHVVEGGASGAVVGVARTGEAKCGRCWYHGADVGDAGLCPRCEAVVEG